MPAADDGIARPQRPRLLHVLGKLETGGLQLRVLSLVDALPELAHTVAYREVRSKPVAERFAAACDLVALPSGGVGARFAGLVRALRAVRPRAVIAHLFGNHALVAWAAAIARVPVVFGVAASDPVAFAGSRWRPLLLAQAARPVCRGEVAVSEFVGSVLRERLALPAARVTVIPNGCPVASIRARVAAVRARESPARETTRLLVAARLGGARDQPTALAALARLRAAGRPVELWLAGDGMRRGELERAAEALGVAADARFLGDRDDVPELMAASDLLVHPAEHEAFGMVLAEAMAAGLPIVASDVGGCRELLAGGACGLLYRPGDADDLAAAIGRLADDGALRSSLVAAASRRVEERYDLPRMVAGYRELLRPYLL